MSAEDFTRVTLPVSGSSRLFTVSVLSAVIFTVWPAVSSLKPLDALVSLTVYVPRGRVRVLEVPSSFVVSFPTLLLALSVTV